jgi:L,D-transpeptidase YbiS
MIVLSCISMGKSRTGIGRRLERGGLVLTALAVLVAGGCDQGQSSASAEVPSTGLDRKTLEKRVETLRKENGKLETRLQKLTPKEPFIVVNTTLNRIYVKEGEKVLVDAVCSTGSNTELRTPDGKRRWFFSTPRGVFKVRSRMKRPTWVKPDWAFIEEGEPVPPPGSPDRYETGVLGDYGLYFGNGFLIHGTLFQRFLGQGVTHGCVRVGDDDLAQIWEKTKVGTPIYIF